MQINQANPLVNGQTLTRKIELTNGVLLQDRTLMLFYRETVSPSLLQESGVSEG